MKLAQFSIFPSRSKLCVLFVVACLLIVADLLSPVATLIASEPLAKGIQDNSFLIEEAYNQEPGVVQHILNVPINFINGSREIAPSFTRKSSTQKASRSLASWRRKWKRLILI